jgi:hypothetical protein
MLHVRMQMSCSVTERSLAVLFCALSSHKNSNIWTGLWKCATKGVQSSPQSNSTKHRSSATHHELRFQNANDPLAG